ncbi:RNA polymerase subunit sigma [Herminiimonas sp. KBW02]|uniref:sigma-70 family RNA polymerase sigma factor n=1 Tax=Herminiimonas sp. KBW02 TaxID=2153363 RepID=UPI000F594232|nr:sigma-70 family RNA polymerase sigma factor [Herminiimonas sp. KBW02]RQO33536.1 RNA polymerase subunit sigma [Herminiimonas sp. KBW02]
MPAASDPRLDSVKTLYSDHHGWLHGWLRRKLGCHDMAADLAHETFLKLLAGQIATAGLREPRAFLTTLASRLLIDLTRHQKIEQAYLAELALVMESADCAPTPESILMAIQALKQFSDVLEDMPPKVREAFVLHYIDERSQPDISKQLGVSVRMVQKYLAQALVKCHSIISQ